MIENTTIPPSNYEFGSFRLDVKQHRLLREEASLQFSKLKFLILRLLLERRNEVVTYDTFWAAGWPNDKEPPGYPRQHKIQVHIDKIRDMLEDYGECIKPVSGVGYIFSDEILKDVEGKVPSQFKSFRDDLQSQRLYHVPSLNADLPSKSLEEELSEKTYFRYRDTKCPLVDSQELVEYLEIRHGCSALSLCGKSIPATIVWGNIENIIRPDQILGMLDHTAPEPLTSSPTLSSQEYAAARVFIEKQYTKDKIKHEGCDYRMTKIDLSANPPLIYGAFGQYYDNILTQYAMEWELKKALLRNESSSIQSLAVPGTLPLREAVEIETQNDPFVNGSGRCAAITISTLLVFQRSAGGYFCLIRRRSMQVGVSPGMLHAVPAGMFETYDTSDNWSIELNIWRELLKEAYNEEEAHGSGIVQMSDHILGKKPVKLINKLLRKGIGEFSVTGIVCDLLNLRPEVCTVLFIPDKAFVEARKMEVNWEYEPESHFGKFAVPWERIDEVLEKDGAEYGIVPSGAACILLGRKWLKRRYGI